jgi:hypothetical protein
MKPRPKAALAALALGGYATAAARVVKTIETSAEAARRLALGLLEAEARAQIDTTTVDLPPVRDPAGIYPVVRVYEARP